MVAPAEPGLCAQAPVSAMGAEIRLLENRDGATDRGAPKTLKANLVPLRVVTERGLHSALPFRPITPGSPVVPARIRAGRAR